MYDAVDLPELRRMADLAEATPDGNFKMSAWKVITSCGTAGCLVGTWCMNTIGDRLHLNECNNVVTTGCYNLWLINGIASRFGMTPLVAMFLFVHAQDARGNRLGRCKSATRLTKQEAVARLRMYARHVEDQRRRWANHEWLMQQPKRVRRGLQLSPRLAVGST